MTLMFNLGYMEVLFLLGGVVCLGGIVGGIVLLVTLNSKKDRDDGGE
jgi:hypothetical protein